MEILKNNVKEMLEIKSILTGIRNAFNMLMSRWDIAKERIISELEDTSTETLQNENSKRKNNEKQKKQNMWGNTKRCNIHIIPERKKEREKIFEVIMAGNFLKLMTEPNHRSRKIREHHTQKYIKNYKTRHIIFKTQKNKDNKKNS